MSSPDFPPNKEGCVVTEAENPCVTPNGFVLLDCEVPCPPNPKPPKPKPNAFSAGFDAVTSKPLLVVWVKDDWPKEVFAPNTDTVPTGADPNVLP